MRFGKVKGDPVGIMFLYGRTECMGIKYTDGEAERVQALHGLRESIQEDDIMTMIAGEDLEGKFSIWEVQAKVLKDGMYKGSPAFIRDFREICRGTDVIDMRRTFLSMVDEYKQRTVALQSIS
ncbi:MULTISPECIES: hypothetical protein [Bacillus]|uniref:hypothetical protein n=1 Tax=Bacillus TaxID=1386 RepID=UPI001ABDEDD2|nr:MULTISPECIES: hypothetical protein [Bacillus]MCB4338900.1 hypothetical protein [Bacillus subtilis]MCH4866626.1 hypothetical protein [Bacillus sp. 1006-3]MCL9628419.1 hypothetical protein [Bacillus subtilis]QTG87215.1 hypothetical protein J4048_21370 [Bacillus amyloliquefaciens]